MKSVRNVPMNSWVCVDANLTLKLLLREPDSDKVNSLWDSWLLNGCHIAAPPLLPIEVTAVLRKSVYRGRLAARDGWEMLQKVPALGVAILNFDDLHQRAWVLAEKLNRPTAYDTHYVALAEWLNCDFWTADRRLYNAAAPTLPWVHILDEIDA